MIESRNPRPSASGIGSLAYTQAVQGLRPAGPAEPLIANDAELKLGSATLKTRVMSRLILEGGPEGGLDLPSYTTSELASITNPTERRMVWDSTVKKVKVYDGSSYVLVSSAPPPSNAVYNLCGKVVTDWNDGGGYVECVTFVIQSADWGGKTLRFQATGRVSRAGLTGHVGLYNLNLPSGPPVLITQFNFTDDFDNFGDATLGTAPNSQIWQIKIALIGGAGAPDSFTLGSAAFSAA